MKLGTALLDGTGRVPGRVHNRARLAFLRLVDRPMKNDEVLEEMRVNLSRWALAPTVRFSLRLEPLLV